MGIMAGTTDATLMSRGPRCSAIHSSLSTMPSKSFQMRPSWVQSYWRQTRGRSA